MTARDLFEWTARGILLCYLVGALLPTALFVLRRSGDASQSSRPELPSWTHRWALGWTIAGSLLAAAGGVTWLILGGPDPLIGTLLNPEATPFTAGFVVAWQLRLDSLAALFLVLVGGFAATVGLYSLGALGTAEHFRPQRDRIAVGYALFVAATVSVIVADDAFAVPLAREAVSLTFAFLTLYKHNRYFGHSGPPVQAHEPEEYLKGRREAITGPGVYLVFGHLSTLLLVCSLFLLAGLSSGPHPAGTSYCANKIQTPQVLDLSFETIRSCRPTGPIASLAFLLGLAGLGIGAGLLGAHVWAPQVHPQSPTTTHAFSLGVAIKVNVYLMYRVFFELAQPESWWGIVVLLLGALTAVVAVRYALAVDNLKEKLAYHSIENIGIMVAAIGVALIFGGQPLGALPAAQAVAVIALVASVAHLINHAMFKGLLYLATGALEMLTREEVELGRLGGLQNERYRWILASFVVGSLAISGFPPLNGFVGEWLLLVSARDGVGALTFLIEHGPTDASRVAVLLTFVAILVALIVAVSLLASAFALTALCFLEVLGIGVLGPRRTRPQERVDWLGRVAAKRYQLFGLDFEVPPSMASAMALLALACVALGVGAPWLASFLGGILIPLIGFSGVAPVVAPTLAVPTPWWLLTVLATATAFAVIAVLINFMTGTSTSTSGRQWWLRWRSMETRYAPDWHGGSPRLEHWTMSPTYAGAAAARAVLPGPPGFAALQADEAPESDVLIAPLVDINTPIAPGAHNDVDSWAAVAPVVTGASLTWNTESILPNGLAQTAVTSGEDEWPAQPDVYEVEPTSLQFDGAQYELFWKARTSRTLNRLKTSNLRIAWDERTFLEVPEDGSTPTLHMRESDPIRLPLFWDRYKVTEAQSPRIIVEPFRSGWNRIFNWLDELAQLVGLLDRADLREYLGYSLVGAIVVLVIGTWLAR